VLDATSTVVVRECSGEFKYLDYPTSNINLKYNELLVKRIERRVLTCSCPRAYEKH
jgi:hypothetical protein